MINMQFLRNFKTSDKSYLLLSVILKKKILLELFYKTKSANCCFVIFANQEKWILNPWLEKMLFYVFVCVCVHLFDDCLRLNNTPCSYSATI